MAWTDAPSEGQMGAWWRLTKWALPDNVQTAAMEWLEKHADRKQMSDELARVRELYIKRNLDERSCFDSSIWIGFDYRQKLQDDAESNDDAIMQRLRKLMH